MTFDLAELKREIERRHGSVYAFAKAVGGGLGLTRGTLYQVLAGRYGGNLARQAEKIKAALAPEAPQWSGPDVAGLVEILKEVACGRCRRPRPRARQCGQCADLWRAQAAALAGREK